LDKIGEDQLIWQSLKDSIEGHTLEFTLNKQNFNLAIQMPDSDRVFHTDVNHLKGRTRINDEGQIKVHRVDTIRKQLKFDFI
jgi:hypothetical protein